MALGLAMTAMLAFGALGAGAAQASPTWHIDGNVFTGKEAIESNGGSLELETSYAGLPVSIECQGQESTSATIFSGDESKALLRLSECAVEAEGVEPGVCAVEEPLIWGVRAELIEVGGLVYDKFTPSTAGTFATFGLEGEECPFWGVEYGLTGSFAAEVGPEAIEPTLTFSREAAEATGTDLQWFDTVHLEGTSSRALSGVNAGEEWGAY